MTSGALGRTRGYGYGRISMGRDICLHCCGMDTISWMWTLHCDCFQVTHTLDRTPHLLLCKKKPKQLFGSPGELWRNGTFDCHGDLSGRVRCFYILPREGLSATARVSLARMCMHVARVCLVAKELRSTGCPGAGVVSCWELSPCSLKEQPALSTSKLSLQPQRGLDSA